MVKIVLPDHKTVGWNYLYQSGHWQRRKQVADTIHSLVFCYCRSQKIQPVDHPVIIELIAHAVRPLDPDNICAKLYIDGLVKAGVIKDDNRNYVSEVTLISQKTKKGESKSLEICIYSPSFYASEAKDSE